MGKGMTLAAPNALRPNWRGGYIPATIDAPTPDMSISTGLRPQAVPDLRFSLGDAIRRGVLRVLLACAFLFPLLAHAQAPLSGPNVNLLKAGGPRVLAQQADGRILVGGSHRIAGKDSFTGFTSIGPLHRINADGTVDASFRPAPDGDVTRIVVSGNFAYVAGFFSAIGGKPIAHLAKISLADGTAVADWKPAADYPPSALVVDADGYVYAAGSFASIGGLTGRSLVKLDPATGQAMSSWNPAFPTALSEINTLLATTAGLYVAGRVANDAAGLLGRLHRVGLGSGAIDATFAPPVAATNHPAPALAVDASGNLLWGAAGGSLLSCDCPGGQSQPLATGLLRFLAANGGKDPAWPPNATESTSAVAVAGNVVYSIAFEQQTWGGGLRGIHQILRRDAATGIVTPGWTAPLWHSERPYAILPAATGVVIGGDFAETGATYTPGLARVDTNTGAVQTSWAGGTYQRGQAYGVKRMADGRLLIGGNFDLVNFQRRSGLARLQADGSLDGTFAPRLNNGVWAMLEFGGSLYVGGFFTRINGLEIPGVAKLNMTTGAPDPAWVPNPDGDVRKLATDGVDLVVAGGFRNIGGGARTAVAKLSASTGSLITAFNANIDPVNNSCQGTHGMALAGGWVYSGCRYRLGTGVVANLHRFSATTGARDATWSPNPSSLVRDIQVRDGKVYLLGDFGTVDGQAKPFVARVEEGTGVLDSAWASGIVNGSSGVTYAGEFIGAHFYVARLVQSPTEGISVFRLDTATGARDTSWNPSFTVLTGGNFFMGLAANASGNGLHVAGAYTAVATEPRSGFATLSTAVASTFPAISSGPQHSLAVDAAGKLYAWGNDSYGQLGVGRSVIRPTPAKVAGLPAITQVSLSSHAVAVDSFKRVWAWGDNTCGQLGPRDSATASRPARVTGLRNVVMAGAGRCYTVVALADGTVWGWGLVPGYGTETAPRQLTGLAGIVEVIAGPRHVLARRGSDGAVFAFGENTLGQLGTGALGSTAAATQVPGLTGVTALAASDARSMALLSGGQLRLWGAGVATPSALPPPGSTVTAIALSSENVAHILRADGLADLYDGTAWAPAFPGGTGLTRLAAGGVLLGINSSGQLFASGNNARGMLGQGNTTAQPSAVSVPGFTSTSRAVASDNAVLALRGDGSLWFWGQDVSGESGDGGAFGSSVPQAVTFAGKAIAVAAGTAFSAALDDSGAVWRWGANGQIIAQSTPSKAVSNDITAIAAGSGFLAVLTKVGSVYVEGTTLFGGEASGVYNPVRGFAGVTRLAAGDAALYGLGQDGKVWAAGLNAAGQLGNGSTASSQAAVPVQGISGEVRRIAAGGNRAGAITSDGKVWMWGAGPLGNGGRTSASTAVQVAGIGDAVDLSVGSELVMVLKADGTVVGWGDVGLATVGADPLVPYAIALGRTPQSVFAGDGNTLGFMIDVNGAAWGFGKYGRVTAYNAAIGDGTYVARSRPVLLLASAGAGTVDANDWYLDLDPATGQTVPAAATPRSLVQAEVSGADTGLVVTATIKYKTADLGKSVNNYVLGLVPTTFFGLVKTAPTLSSPPKLAAKSAKTNGFVLAQLTPAGWTDVSGQLIAYSQGTANAAGNATNILNGINASSIPGAKFCIGYGESSGSMLSAGSLTEVLSLEGASSSASGVPCVLSGIYVDGPATSTAGSVVNFKASVVGLSPTGTVQFSDGGANLSSPVSLATSSEAVGTSSLDTSALAVGSHSIGATYGGNAQNAAVAAEIPLLHQVIAAAPGASATTLAGPSSSELGSEVVFTATVAGNSPTGSVQFRDGATNLGAAVPLVGGAATLRTGALAQGSHSITAVYSGDGSNTTSTSSAIAHTVAGAIETTVTLASSGENSTLGGSVTFTATVTGTNPTGNVIFRDGATVIGTVALQNGVATLTVSSLGAGQHVVTAEYAGDGTNQAVTSTSIFQQVSVPAALSPNPASLSFGGQSMNTTSPAQTVTFINGGASALTVTSVTASTYFAVSHNCASVAGGASCSATVTFLPSVEGVLSGTLSLVTSAGVVTVGLSGTGEKSLTTHYYLSILRRAPDAGGKAFWEAEAARVRALGANVNEVWFAMAQSFFGSAEYRLFNRDDAGFVTDLYNTFFNRAPDAGGFADWMTQLAAGMPREVVLASFMFSREFTNFTQAIFGTTVTRKEVDTVIDFYRGLLGELPDDGGFNFWLQPFRTAQCQAGAAVNAQVERISSEFANSPQYLNRARTNAQYVGDLYNAFLRRGADGDLAGVQYWISQITSGARSRENVRQEFVASPEFQARVAAIIAQGCIQ